MAGIITIAILLSIFTTLFLIFGFTKMDKKIGTWIILLLLFTWMFSMTVHKTPKEYSPPSSFLLGQYSTL